MVHLVLLTGSLRKASCNTGLLRSCAAAITALGHTAELIVPSALPLFSQDLEADEENPLMANVRDFRKRIQEADAVVLGCPEYNYSVSCVMKNALDWASRSPVRFVLLLSVLNVCGIALWLSLSRVRAC